jgi:hypothetical protein
MPDYRTIVLSVTLSDIGDWTVTYSIAPWVQVSAIVRGARPSPETIATLGEQLKRWWDEIQQFADAGVYD